MFKVRCQNDRGIGFLYCMRYRTIEGSRESRSHKYGDRESAREDSTWFWIQMPLLPTPRPSHNNGKGIRRRLGLIRCPFVALFSALLVTFCLERLQRRDSQVRIMRHKAGLKNDAVGHCPPLWACLAFAGYLIWNIRYLASGRVPPSMLLGILGLPCPTTGCMRSLESLLHGSVSSSLAWNPFTVPIVVLLILSGLTLGRSVVKTGKPVLSNWIGTAWWTVLLAAWIAKFLLGRNYW